MKKHPWPTKAVMTQIYELGLWGKSENGDKYYSGEGSHHPNIVGPYLNFIQSFLKQFNEKLSLTDLGCGDFNIGKNILPYVSFYHAIDIVDDLIKYNEQKFKFKNLQFSCIDILKDEIPKTNCLIIKQVLQHLNNQEISLICSKLYNFKYIILTEHLPNNDFVANLDIISGQRIRLKLNSGVDILQPPFNFKPKEIVDKLVLKSPSYSGEIVTEIFKMF